MYIVDISLMSLASYVIFHILQLFIRKHIVYPDDLRTRNRQTFVRMYLFVESFNFLIQNQNPHNNN